MSALRTKGRFGGRRTPVGLEVKRAPAGVEVEVGPHGPEGVWERVYVSPPSVLRVFTPPTTAT